MFDFIRTTRVITKYNLSDTLLLFLTVEPNISLLRNISLIKSIVLLSNHYVMRAETILTSNYDLNGIIIRLMRFVNKGHSFLLKVT